jgi:hypothetical protein
VYLSGTAEAGRKVPLKQKKGSALWLPHLDDDEDGFDA